MFDSQNYQIKKASTHISKMEYHIEYHLGSFVI